MLCNPGLLAGSLVGGVVFGQLTLNNHFVTHGRLRITLFPCLLAATPVHAVALKVLGGLGGLLLVRGDAIGNAIVRNPEGTSAFIGVEVIKDSGNDTAYANIRENGIGLTGLLGSSLDGLTDVDIGLCTGHIERSVHVA